MKRLTRKASKKELIESKYMFNYVDNSSDPNPLSNPRKVSEAYDKLGKLEDLAEQLGCPLEVLVKLVNGDPFYYEDEEGMHFIIDYSIENNTINFEDDWQEHDMEVGDFGGIELVFTEYKKSFWLKEDKSK